MKKIFLPQSFVRNNALKLAHKVYEEGFFPDIIYVSLRGGAYIGNVISEYFKLLTKKLGRRPVFYAAVVARSYEDVQSHVQVRVDGWTYAPEYLRQGDRVLVCDDIFDSGYTIDHLVGILLNKGLPREDIKVMVHDYKVRQYLKEQLPIQPDYYCNKHELKTKEDDFWIHYLSHELVGLDQSEVDDYYLKEDKGLSGPLSVII